MPTYNPKEKLLTTALKNATTQSSTYSAKKKDKTPKISKKDKNKIKWPGCEKEEINLIEQSMTNIEIYIMRGNYLDDPSGTMYTSYSSNAMDNRKI